MCYCKSGSRGEGYVNMYCLFLIVLAPWPSNDVMAMHDPQAHFWCLISFPCIFLLGILIWLHNPLWIISFACTTTWRDFSILQVITTLILTIDICIYACSNYKQDVSFYSFLFPSFMRPLSQSHVVHPQPHSSPQTHRDKHIHLLDPSQQFISQFKRQFRAVHSS